MLTKFLQQIPGFFLNIHLNKNGQLSFPYLDDKFLARQSGYYMSQQQCSEFMLSMIDAAELARLSLEMQTCIQEQSRLVTTLGIQFPGKEKLHFELFGSCEQLSDQSSIWYVYANEMTDLINLTQGFLSQEDKIKKTLNHLPDAVLTVSKSGLIRTCNNAVLQIFGYQKELLIDQLVYSLFACPATLTAEHFQRLSISLSNQGEEVFCKTRLGKSFPAELRVLPVSCSQDDDLLVIIRDLSEQKASEAMLKQFYYYDALTMIPGRVELEKRVEEAIGFGKTEQLFSALILIDIEGFRQFNQQFGAEKGDRLLVLFSQRLKQTLRPQDCVCRFGGDEFVVLLNGLQPALLQSEQQLQEQLHSIQQILAPEFCVQQQLHRLQFKSTTIVFDCSTSSTPQLMRQLDLIAYQARLFDAADKTAKQRQSK